MTDRQLLYDAIVRRPADDLARGVYADWLEERGEVDRAREVRGPDPLNLTEEFFFDGHRPTMRGARKSEGVILHRSRGLDFGLSCTAKQFADCAPSFFRWAPFTHVWLLDLQPRAVPAVTPRFRYVPVSIDRQDELESLQVAWAWETRDRRLGGRLLGVGDRLRAKRFDTFKCARIALSCACVDHARSMLGLPPLD